MKKMVCSLLTVLILIVSCTDVNPNRKTNIKPENGDFYNLQWGMSKEAVISLLGKEVEDSFGDLHYPNREISGLKCAVYCSFINDSLSQGLFSFYEPLPGNPQAYIEEYDRLKAILTEKYNRPASDTVKCYNSTISLNKQYWGPALYSGTLELLTTWVTSQTIIGLGLRNSSSAEIDFSLIYYDRLKFPRIASQVKAKEKEGL